MRYQRTIRALAAAATLLIPISVAGPASANFPDTSTDIASAPPKISQDGCSVTLDTPYATGNRDTANRPQVNFRLRVRCEPGRTISVRQKLYERDQAGSQLLESKLRTLVFDGQSAETKSVNSYRYLTPTDGDGTEEVYHTAYFRVTGGGIKGQLSPTKSSSTRVIYV